MTAIKALIASMSEDFIIAPTQPSSPPSAPGDSPPEETETESSSASPLSQRSARWSTFDAPTSRERLKNRLESLDASSDSEELDESETTRTARANWERTRAAVRSSSQGDEYANGQARVLPEALERLREHPRFNLEQAYEQNLQDTASTQEILLSHSVAETDREPLFQLDLLRMFRQRMRFLAILGMLLSPLFYVFYSFLSPPTARLLVVPHLLLVLICGVYTFIAPRIASLMLVRILTFIGYVLICANTSLTTAILVQSPIADAPEHSIQFVVLAAHSQILLSLVLLPLALWESALLAVVIGISLVWSAWSALPEGADAARSAQIFVLATTGIFVLCVAHFQSMLRRRAFESSFELARSAARLQTLSTLDAVTGGFNRLYLEKTLALEISRAARFRHPLAVMMLDLDNFKAVNDTRGHTAGDQVLRVVWEAATTAMRDVDTVARYGGDEFMVVLPETEASDAFPIAQRLQAITADRLRQCFGTRYPEAAVTLSIGIVAVHPTEACPIGDLIALADERLYEAKRLGKNRIAI